MENDKEMYQQFMDFLKSRGGSYNNNAYEQEYLKFLKEGRTGVPTRTFSNYDNYKSFNEDQGGLFGSLFREGGVSRYTPQQSASTFEGPAYTPLTNTQYINQPAVEVVGKESRFSNPISNFNPKNTSTLSATPGFNTEVTNPTSTYFSDGLFTKAGKAANTLMPTLDLFNKGASLFYGAKNYSQSKKAFADSMRTNALQREGIQQNIDAAKHDLSRQKKKESNFDRFNSISFGGF